jgi:hypothetical protein
MRASHPSIRRWTPWHRGLNCLTERLAISTLFAARKLPIPSREGHITTTETQRSFVFAASCIFAFFLKPFYCRSRAVERRTHLCFEGRTRTGHRTSADRLLYGAEFGMLFNSIISFTSTAVGPSPVVASRTVRGVAFIRCHFLSKVTCLIISSHCGLVILVGNQ